ncbi:MAG: CoA ester lyase [Acidobacteriia bacterium]|nr:CoA ester lyase [Terriglobia bacterium]
MITGLRRSALYIPCDRRKMVEKSVEYPADLLLLNLEDGIAASSKDTARANAVGALKALDFGAREVVVRINSLESEAGRCDLAAVLPCRPDGICLPKIETPAAVRAAETAILELESGHESPEGGVRLHAMIESAAGVLSARDIAASSSRMASLIFGSADYCDDVHCQPGEDRIELWFALQMVVAGARAAAVDAIDGPCFDISNQDLLHREATQARRFGFDGKSALHPGQLGTINGVFDVTPEERIWAEKVVAELQDAENRGRALSTLEGHLIDNPHRNAAQRILRRARLSRK